MQVCYPPTPPLAFQEVFRLLQKAKTSASELLKNEDLPPQAVEDYIFDINCMTSYVRFLGWVWGRARGSVQTAHWEWCHS